MESQRDLTQIIVHVDMDAFYANVEILDKPSLKGTVFAVSDLGINSIQYLKVSLGWRWGAHHSVL